MNALTITVLFDGKNLNYGESFGNVAGIKKFTSRGKSYSYVSRQALRYDIVRLLNESFGVPPTPVTGGDNKVVQFEDKAKISDYPEIDLFGYMKTEKKSKGKIRKAVVRLTDAVSIEPFNNEIEFGTNKALADRGGYNNAIFNVETHRSFYSYTATIDLDKIGVDANDKIELETEERAIRVNGFLDAVRLLYRDIKGRRENLSPVFVIGGLYAIGNPFFYNKPEIEFTHDKTLLNCAALNETMRISTPEGLVKDSSSAGVLSGLFTNIDELECDVTEIEDFFSALKNKVTEYYSK